MEYELCRKFQIYIAAYFTTKSLSTETSLAEMQKYQHL